MNTCSNEGERICTQKNNAITHTHKKQRQEREYKITQEQLKNNARISHKSLEGVVTECRSVGVLLRCLVLV
jgi:mevalonate kinase